MEIIAIIGIVAMASALFGQQQTRVHMAQHGISHFGQTVAGLVVGCVVFALLVLLVAAVE